MQNSPKIALVHEFFTQLGGAERVLAEFLNLYPDATIFTLVYNSKRTGGLFDFYKKKTSFLQYLPFARSHHRWYLSLMPVAMESFDFSGYDIVLADASAFAKGVKVPESSLFICYCHTPTRYLWLETREYIESLNYPFFIKMILPPVISWLRRWDYKAAQRPHHFIANSQTVRDRIKKFYNRDSVVIYPPVDTEFFHPTGNKENYFFAASRLEPYKKIKIVIEAFNDLGLPLKIAGSGTASASLRKIARPNIEFLGRVTDEELRRRYSEAQAYIFPAQEDAGIMPLEAMSCGTPVIAYRSGGAQETVIEGKTGIFFDKQDSESIKRAVESFSRASFDQAAIREHSLKFDKKIFREKIKSLIEEWHAEFRNQNF